MTKHKHFLYLTFFLLALPFCAVRAQDLPDTPENRQKQAERYLATAPPKALFEEIAEKNSHDLPPTQQDKFKASFLAAVRLDEVQKTMVDALAKHFTAAEMKALADFYGSAVGKSAMTKLGSYMAEIKPSVQAEIQRAQQAANDSLLTK